MVRAVRRASREGMGGLEEEEEARPWKMDWTKEDMGTVRCAAGV